jgi:hypothetical protein
MDMSLRLHGGIEPGAKQMMENIGDTLRANGLSLDDEVHCDACRHVQVGRVQPDRFELVVDIKIIARDGDNETVIAANPQRRSCEILPPSRGWAGDP